MPRQSASRFWNSVWCSTVRIASESALSTTATSESRFGSGDRVTKGQVIAKLGNTGNANASHMHFHLMDGPSVLGSDGLPYVIDRFSYDGQVAPQTILDADDFLSGQFLQGRLPTPEPRTDQLPAALAIVNFPT